VTAPQAPADESGGGIPPRVKEPEDRLQALGKHIVCELSGCDPAALTDVDSIHAMMISAAKAARATIMESAFHRFEPQGVSGTVILAESHLSIHTWPEKGYAAMDFYTCGDHTDPWLACEVAAEALKAKSVLTTEFRRGIEKSDGEFTHVVSRDRDLVLAAS
jgi:S-adenosylmethionine decarboxylase